MKNRLINENTYAKGELDGPDGFCAQTPNGSAYATGLGWNQDKDWKNPEATPGGAWQRGRSNRTGE